MRLLIGFGLILFCLCTKLDAQVAYNDEIEAEIKRVESNICGPILINDEQPSSIRERMAFYKVKGLSIAVVKDFKVVWARGYGWADEAEKRPVSLYTLFEPGSISKTLNSLGILKLAQEKRVDLNTDINAYLRSWKFPYDSLSNGKKITLAHILSHNAGLTVHGFPGHDIKGPIPTVFQVLDGTPPSFTPAVRSMYEPGMQFEYSGGGTTISQVLLCDVTKQAYDKWMYDNVLRPIGMIHSSYAQPPTKEMQSLCASAYTRDGAPIEGKFHVYPEQAAAGLWMTPSDLCQYIIDMQLAYKGKKASAVLSPEMVKLHLTAYNNGPTAMGTFIQDHDGALYFEHGAGNDGFCGDFIASLEDGYGVAIFMNSDNPKLLSEVINSVAKEYNWKNFYREPHRKKAVTVPDSILREYEGVYLYDRNWAGVGRHDNEYQFYANGMFAKMYFTSPTCFFNTEFQAVKEFVRDDRGEIVGYTRTVDGKAFAPSTRITNPDTLHAADNIFQEIGWFYFEAKKYKESLAYLKRGAELYPKNLDLVMNLAHVFLFSGDKSSAMKIYKAHRNEEESPGYSWEKMLESYIKYFKEHDFDVSVFDEVRRELGLDKH